MCVLRPKASMTTMMAGYGPFPSGWQRYTGMRPSAVGSDSISVRMSMDSPVLETQQPQQVRSQIVELGASLLSAQQTLDALAQAGIDSLAHEGTDARLGLGADPLIRQTRGDRVGGHDGARGKVELVVEVEAVNVVVHSVKEVEARRGMDQPHHLPAHEEAPRPAGRAVELGHHGRGHLARVEEGPSRAAVGEARVGQVDPARVVQLPAGARPARQRASRHVGREPGRLTRQARDLDAGVDEELRARTGAGQLRQSSRETAHHPGAREIAEAIEGGGIDVAGECSRLRGAHLVARGGSADRAQLYLTELVAHANGVSEGVVVRVVDPAVHFFFNPPATTEKRRDDHERGKAGMKRRSRRLFATTDTEDSAMAIPARMGDKVIPHSGYSTPAATGTRSRL